MACNTCRSMDQVLDLRTGHPHHALLPRQALAEACLAASADMRAGSDDGLGYCSREEGSPEFLQELADFIGRQCPGEPVPRARDGLLLTTGVSHGLELATSVFAQRGEAVLMEAPGYFLAEGIFKSRGLEVVPVPTDSEGMVVEAIEGILDARAPSSARVRLIYTIPAFHNPTGCTLPAARRRMLVDIARRRGLLILADEVYHMLAWPEAGARPPRLVCYDEAYVARHAAAENGRKRRREDSSDVAGDQGSGGGAAVGLEATVDVTLEPVVMSIGSFTKILSPGLRVGWVEAAPQLIKQLATVGYLVSGSCVCTFMSDRVVKHTLKSRSADAVLQGLIKELQERAARLCAALEKAGLKPLVQPAGGYFVWVPLGLDAQRVAEAAEARKMGVTFMPGGLCDPSGDAQLAQCARLCFAMLPADQLDLGVQRLALAVEATRAQT